DDLAAQAALAVRVRDDISKVTDMVSELRSVRDQLKARNLALDGRKDEERIAPLLKEAQAAITRADALEDRLPSPTAEGGHDVLGMRGGTRLYWGLAFLQVSVVGAEAAPTAGMMQVLVEEEKDLAALEAETKQFMTGDVARINQ